MSARFDGLVERLEQVAAELDELMFDDLREASAAGGRRPADDKRMVQARRAVEKAIGLLRDGGGGASSVDQ
jgi:hypothetical protein